MYVFRSGTDTAAAEVQHRDRQFTLSVCAVPRVRDIVAIPRKCLMLVVATADERWIRAVTMLGRQRGFDEISLGEELTFTIAGELPAVEVLLTSITTLLTSPPFELDVARRSSSLRAVTEIRVSPILEPYRESVFVQVDLDHRTVASGRAVTVSVLLIVLVSRRTPIDARQLHQPTSTQAAAYRTTVSRYVRAQLSRTCSRPQWYDAITLHCVSTRP
jgi:hypothetical protein